MQSARETEAAMNVEELARELRKAERQRPCDGVSEGPRASHQLAGCSELPTGSTASPETIPSHKKGFQNGMSTLVLQEAHGDIISAEGAAPFIHGTCISEAL